MTAGHILQSRANTCLAACVSMVLAHRGHPLSEAELIEAWGQPPPPGYPLAWINRVLGAQYIGLGLNRPEDLSLLEGHLRRSWLIALMFTGPMTVFALEHTPRLDSPHGPLVTFTRDRQSLMNHGQSLHTVVLTDRWSDGVILLDPYHTADHQPLRMSDEWLVQASTGSFWLS